MTINGWLQIALFSVADLRCHQAAWRVHGAGLQSREDLPGSSASANREANLPLDRSGRKARNGMDRVCRGHAVVQRGFYVAAVCDPARAGISAVQSSKAGRCQPAESGVEYRGIVHHQYKLASLLWRNNDDLLHPDGGPRVPQLCFGSHGNCVGHRTDSWQWRGAR